MKEYIQFAFLCDFIDLVENFEESIIVECPWCQTVIVGCMNKSFRDCNSSREFQFHEIGDLGKLNLVDLQHGGQLVAYVIKFLIHRFKMLLMQIGDVNQVWWNKESEILNSHLKCFSLEKHIGVRRKEATVNHATSYEILCEK